MSTRSTVLIRDESNLPLVRIYRQCDGYFEGMGAELQKFLKEMVILNGIGGRNPVKCANGMGCLAAQLIAHLKEGIGGVYVTNLEDRQEFNYEISFLLTPRSTVGVGRVSLVGRCIDGEKRTFNLYEPIPSPILRRVTFVYDKKDGEPVRWRTLDVTEETSEYLMGYDVDSKGVRKFLFSRILGGRVYPA